MADLRHLRICIARYGFIIRSLLTHSIWPKCGIQWPTGAGSYRIQSQSHSNCEQSFDEPWRRVRWNYHGCNPTLAIRGQWIIPDVLGWSLRLTAFQAHFDDFVRCKVHIDGLQQMIQRRGSLENLAEELLWEIAWYVAEILLLKLPF
jgi:hypothetical protein